MEEDKKIQRNFILGDKWIYFKIYTGYKVSDNILIEIIGPLVEKFLKNGVIDRWFFIRYGDPKHHLRVRFHATSPQSILTVIQNLYPHLNKLLEEKLIWKIQTDTYKREIERYGINSMFLSEKIFYHNSIMIVNFLSLTRNEEDEDIRWLFSLKSIDSLLNSFGYKLRDKTDLLLSLSTSFKQEFNSSKFLVKQLSKKYRNKQDKIEEFLSDELKMKSYNHIIFDIIDKHEHSIKKIVTEIQSINSLGKLEVHLNYLMSSYIHMLMNRLFKSENRLYEMVCYGFLYKYYKSKCARL